MDTKSLSAASRIWMRGFGSGCGGAVGPSMLADVIDYDEYVSGERKEGAYSAAQGFAIKAAHALIILLTGVLLQASGFEPNVDQGRAAELAIRGLFAGAPFTMFSLAAVVFGHFQLDHREHGRIRAELDARRALR